MLKVYKRIKAVHSNSAAMVALVGTRVGPAFDKSAGFPQITFSTFGGSNNYRIKHGTVEPQKGLAVVNTIIWSEIEVGECWAIYDTMKTILEAKNLSDSTLDVAVINEVLKQDSLESDYHTVLVRYEIKYVEL